MALIPPVSPAVCAVCETSRAVVDCSNCKVAMCLLCSDTLHKGASHATYPYGQDGVEVKACPKHGRGMLFWCSGAVGCDECFGASSRSGVQDAFLDTLDSLHAALRQVEEVVVDVERELNMCHSLKQHIQSNGETLRAEITAKCEAAVAALQKKCTLLCNEVSMKEMKKLTKVSIEEDILRNTLASARSQIDESKGLLTQRCSIALFGKGRAVTKLRDNKRFLEANSGYRDICKTVPNFCLSLTAIESLADYISSSLSFDETFTKDTKVLSTDLQPSDTAAPQCAQSTSLIQSIVQSYSMF